MKWILVFPILLLAFSLQAQNKLPKIRHQESFFADKYELGDKDVKPAEIKLHLEKNNTDAYYKWRRADAQETNTVIFMALATASLLTGVFVKDDNLSLAGYGSAVLFSGIPRGRVLEAENKRKKGFVLKNGGGGYKKKKKAASLAGAACH